MKAIVLLHGWGTNAAVFDELARALAGDFSVYAPDLPGYGESPACEPYGLERLAMHVSGTAPERCHVAGWSLGAQVALCWARMKPRQIESLTLFGATPCFVACEGWAAALQPAELHAFFGALADDPERALKRFVSLQARDDVARKQVAQTLQTALKRRRMPAAGVLADGLRILERTDLRELLSAIEQRCLIVHGARDHLVPAGAAAHLAHTLPRATLELLPGAAHAPFLSDPKIVSALIREHCR
jgi:pimeloyl-[acyl-carrier protein] methyl ester esterase